MVYWETAHARDGVQRKDPARTELRPEAIRQLKATATRDITVGGPDLAAQAIKAGLVDEYHLFVNPVVLGGGTPFFPPLERRIALELLETRNFGSKVIHLRYRAG